MVMRCKEKCLTCTVSNYSTVLLLYNNDSTVSYNCNEPLLQTKSHNPKTQKPKKNHWFFLGSQICLVRKPIKGLIDGHSPPTVNYTALAQRMYCT